ncbi:MFS general substrate transporter [Favolaschia claudopus]|uniref:MFS general substrate transporter n=1 Tax=Favolaschia claudopus TaxID=2862362 RepID=A0AAW0BP69_9AGAR
MTLDDSERVPLLDPNPPPTNERRHISGTILIVPLALLCRIATLLPTTTTFYILQQFICRRYYKIHDPASIPPDGIIPDELCAVPAVGESYAAFITVVALLDGIGSLGGYASLSYLAARFGRRTALASVLSIGLAADIALLCSTMAAESNLHVPLFALWLVCSSFSQANLIAFVANIYLVDLVQEESRTSALSSLSGWSALGSILSFSFGGTITTRGGNALVVYVVAGGLWAAGLLYVWLILPESFLKEKRDALLQRRDEPSGSPSSSRSHGIVSRASALLAPLKLLAPVHDPLTGRRNWRLLICAVHMFFGGLGVGYAVPSLVTIVTSLYRYTPAETGYTLTALSATNMFVLTIVIPYLVQLLRPRYQRPVSAIASSDTTTTTDRLDVHIALFSWIVEASAYVVFGYMRTRPTQLLAVILIGCGPGYAPAVRSLVAASVEPLKQGEALGAIEMLWGLGLFASPLLMGGILTASNNRICTADGLLCRSDYYDFLGFTSTVCSGFR